MIAQHAKGHYIGEDLNCAESTLHCANDELALELPGQCFKCVGGFGGGMGCGNLCGALAGSIAAIGLLTIDQRAHQSPRCKELSAEMTARFQAHFGSEMCEKVKENNFKEDIRCLRVVEQTCDLLEQLLRENGLMK